MNNIGKLCVNGLVLAAPDGKHGGQYQKRIRTIDKNIETTIVQKDENGFEIEVTYVSSQVQLKMTGSFNQASGEIILDVAEYETRSYLRKKRYVLLGYTLDYRASTKTSRRPEPAKLRGRQNRAGTNAPWHKHI